MRQISRDRFDLWIVANSAELAHVGAALFVRCARESIEAHGRFSVALSGGNTPKGMYELLATAEFRGQVDWAKVHVFWGDERDVRKDAPESNYRLAHESLLAHVPIPAAQIHRFRTELSTPEAVAADYARQLRAFGADFDLALMGIGEKTVTAASLFPDVPMSPDPGPPVISPWVPELNSFRYSVSAEVLNRSMHVAFLVEGEKKAKVLAEILEGPYEPQRLPAQRIRPLRGKAIWIVDEAAASALKPQAEKQLAGLRQNGETPSAGRAPLSRSR